MAIKVIGDAELKRNIAHCEKTIAQCRKQYGPDSYTEGRYKAALARWQALLATPKADRPRYETANW